MPTSDSHITVNKATHPGKKVATYRYVDANSDVVESEAVTLTDGTGQEMIGPRIAADSIPVTLATDEAPLPIVPVRCTNTSVTAIAATIVPVELLAANPSRLGFTIVNTSTTDTLFVLVSPVGVVSPSFYSVPIAPQSYYEDPVNYVDKVTGIWSGASGSALVTEFLP